MVDQKEKINIEKLSTEVIEVIKGIDEIKKVLDDLKLLLLKLCIQQVKPEEIDDELYEELDNISEDLLKNPEKGLTAEDAIKELLSS